MKKYGLGHGKINVQSEFTSGVVLSRDELLNSGNGMVVNEIADWEGMYNTTFEYYVYDTRTPSIYANTFQYRGLISTFSKISDIYDLEDFANKYGLLGFSHPNPIKEWPTAKYATLEDFYNSDEVSRYGFSELTVEPVDLWFKNVERIRKLMKLYRLLRRYQKGLYLEIEEILLTFKPFEEISTYYHVFWVDGEKTNLFYDESELESVDIVDIHREVLVDSVLPFINQKILIEPSIIESSKTPLGFYVIDIPISKHLLNAIYYDLWKMFGEEMNIELCANADCGLPFIKNKRQEYCSNACKQQAYRNRKKA